MNNGRDIIMNTQPYAEDIGVDHREDGDEIKTGSKAMIDALQMIAWLDAEIEKCERATYVDTMRVGKYNALRDCKKQLLKLLDGLVVG